ncbi:NO-inducible flavohemoprotein [Hazenella coriacea]|uniref:Flavohemoprotein n=1 Tax=Hazenella coriacea TaxID=1179467 RepID=A0A4R3L9H9_9BACL|nr:NO-inducible flavohemoprotein [Hazenella coriacea]TCS94884.1 nitric oxide dioxygenase [Hazenella coriacea]
MLSPKTIEIVKQTVPFLREHREQITTLFYEQMFQEHPELYNIFNITHQKEKSQPRALADTVYAAAANIDDLSSILPVVKRIAYKHRSIGVQPDQYPIVGKHLLAAIKEVLGDAATDEILNAWKETYQVLADVFIEVEKDMYKQANEQAGWQLFRDFLVVKKVKESDVITSFYLQPTDGEKLAPFQPGQYTSVKVHVPGQPYEQIRQYSLSASPHSDTYRISVKREEGRNGHPEGLISSYLHDHIKEGSILPITPPAGDFVLDQEIDTPVVLLAGGVGITPLMSMFETLLKTQPQRPVTLIHATINGSVQAFKKQIEQASQLPQVNIHFCYEQPTEQDELHPLFSKKGYIDEEWLRTIVPTVEADFYFCGPVPFMRAVKQALENMEVAPERIHYEFFGPALQIESEAVQN